MKKLLTESDFNEFPRLNESMLDIVNDMMKFDIPDLMKKIPQEQENFSTTENKLQEEKDNKM